MANSRFTYVRNFETPSNHILPPQTYLIVRLDGRNFTSLADKYSFIKPNDLRAINIMNTAALSVFEEFSDVVMAFGHSDEMSFLFSKESKLYGRRESKILSCVASVFTAGYVKGLMQEFGVVNYNSRTRNQDENREGLNSDIAREEDGENSSRQEKPMSLPSFDGRIVIYPNKKVVKDYFRWRQVDCHINNLYNTTFWTLVQQGGMSRTAAEKELSGTVSNEKNEILFSRFNINYNNEPAISRKGSVIIRDYIPTPSKQETSSDQSESKSKPTPNPTNNQQQQQQNEGTKDPQLNQDHQIPSSQNEIHHDDDSSKENNNSKTSQTSKKTKSSRKRFKPKTTILHTDMIKESFWNEYPWLLFEDDNDGEEGGGGSDDTTMGKSKGILKKRKEEVILRVLGERERRGNDQGRRKE